MPSEKGGKGNWKDLAWSRKKEARVSRFAGFLAAASRIVSGGARKADTGVSRGSAPRSPARAALVNRARETEREYLPALGFPCRRADACMRPRVSRRYACTALQTAIRPTYNMFMYRRATLTLQFMRALTGPQPLGLLSALVLRVRRRLVRLTRPRIYQRGSTCKFTHRRRAEHRLVVPTASFPFVSETSFRRRMARYLYFRRYVRRFPRASPCRPTCRSTGRNEIWKKPAGARGWLARNGTALISHVRVFREDDRNGEAALGVRAAKFRGVIES